MALVDRASLPEMQVHAPLVAHCTAVDKSLCDMGRCRSSRGRLPLLQQQPCALVIPVFSLPGNRKRWDT